MRVGNHVRDRSGEHSGHVTKVLHNDIVEVQWDHAPWGSRVLWHSFDLKRDPERDAEVRVEWERHRDEYQSDRRSYKGD